MTYSTDLNIESLVKHSYAVDMTNHTLQRNSPVTQRNMHNSRSVDGLMQAVWLLYLVDIVAEMINKRISNAANGAWDQHFNF